MKCREITDLLNKLAPESMACDWDNPGLLAGRGDKEIKKILIALDATDRVVEEAVHTGADLILTHHPLIFKPVKKINDEDFIGRRLLTMIRNDICCYAMHTNFDSAPGCMGDLAADLLGLDFQKILEPLGVLDVGSTDGGEAGKMEYGIGKCGLLPEALTLKELARKVRDVYGIPFVSVFGDTESDKLYLKTAICPGAGGSTLKEALRWGAEVYITGDVSHHEGIDAVASGMAVIDAGHYGIEHIFIEFMEKYLRDKAEPDVMILKTGESFPNCIL